MSDTVVDKPFENVGGAMPRMHFSVRGLRVDRDKQPDVTAGELDVVAKDRGDRAGLLSWALTLVTADEPWYPGLGECQLVIDVSGNHRFHGRAALIRSDGGRWHYFNGVGNLEGLDSRFDWRAD
jgi:hypothetical protein